MKEISLSVTDLNWSVNNQKILNNITLHVGCGEFVGIIGPNGSGKSSLLRCIFRYLEADSGSLHLGGKEISAFSIRETAQRIASVLQERSSEFNFTVFEFVIMGRTPHKTMFDFENSEDIRLCEEALAKVGLSSLRDHHIKVLSGGELQRTLLARALCQQAELLLLDEPTNHLDIRYQLEMMQLIKSLGMASLAALHELNLAALFCDRIYVLERGRIVASGIPDEILTEELIYNVYGVRTRVHRQEGNIHIIPDFGEGFDTLPKKPKCKGCAASCRDT